MKFFVWFVFYALKLGKFVDLSPLDIDITGFIHMSFTISFSYARRKFQSFTISSIYEGGGNIESNN